jgi:glycosyltransferase involved in cell wall biosynthesis
MLTEQLDIVYLLASNSARGGIKIQIEHANRLQALGHSVRIFSNAPSPDWIAIEVPWIEISKEPSRILGDELPECQLVVFSFYEQAYAVLKSCLDSGAVPLYFAQGDEILFGSPESDSENKRFIKAAQASVCFPYPILTVSETAADNIRSFGGSDITVIPNGIDRTIFQPRETSHEGPARILSIGWEFPKFKGIGELYAALIKLSREVSAPDFTFVRASPKPNMFAKLPLEVEFHEGPTQSQLAELYAGSYVYVGTSHNESFYLPPLEAMSCGTAVICTDLPAVREYAQPERDYLPFRPGDVGALYSLIRTILTTPELQRRLTENGLRVAEKMDWANIICLIEDFYRGLITRRKEIHRRISAEIQNPTVRYTITPLKS